MSRHQDIIIVFFHDTKPNLKILDAGLILMMYLKCSKLAADTLLQYDTR